MNHITDEDLIDYLHHEVSDAADAVIHAHLRLCGACSARYDAEAAVGESLRAAARADELEFSPLIKAQVWSAIRSAQPTMGERVRAALRPAFALPLAAAFAVAMYFGVPIVRADHTGDSPTVAAAYYFEEHAAEGLENPLADRSTLAPTLAFGQPAASTHAPLIDAAEAATLDDLGATRE